MGYFEDVCQLCGVSFAIARFRTPQEPEDAAWSYYGADFVEYDDDLECEPFSETGCENRTQGTSRGPEHLAGPGCLNHRGYSGARLGLAEMQGCRAIRAIVPKYGEIGRAWQDEDGDEPWEHDSRYFLSGTGDGSPDEAPLMDLDKNRHGLSEILVTNIAHEETNLNRFDDDTLTCGIPVHPHCFNIFVRISQREQGFVDVHGLWRMRTIQGGYDEFFDKFPRHPAVRAGQQQWWSHAPGAEWLAANPIKVPGMVNARSLLREHESFNVNRDVFEMGAYRRRRMPAVDPDLVARQKRNDPFSVLPPELLFMIMEKLPSKSIAAARLVSRSLRPMPCIAFRRLVLEELPWFWEAEDLPIAKTDWYELFLSAKFTLVELKGIKNRKRIWQDISFLMGRLQKYRAQGKIRGITGWEDDAFED